MSLGACQLLLKTKDNCPSNLTIFVLVNIFLFFFFSFSSENFLKLPQNPEQLMPSFSTVLVMFLNRMKLQWNEVKETLNIFKCL